MTAPTLITPPAGGAMMAGLGVQAVVNEPIAISPARGTQGLRTGRDYVPVLQRRLGNPLTNMLIAGPVEAGCRLNYAIGSAGRVSQVVRQRSAKPPPRVRIPHSPPVFEYDLAPALLFASLLTATVTATPLNWWRTVLNSGRWQAGDFRCSRDCQWRHPVLTQGN